MYEHVLSIVGAANAPLETFAAKPENITFVEDPELLKPHNLAPFETALRAQSQVAFVGLSDHHNMREVALYSCLGKWFGCIPHNASALVYHHGSSVFGDDYLLEFRPAVLHSLQLWLGMASGQGL